MRGEDEQIGHSDRASLIIEFSYPVRVVQLHHGEVIFNRQPIEVRKTRTFLDHFRDGHAHTAKLAKFGQRCGNVFIVQRLLSRRLVTIQVRVHRFVYTRDETPR
jgi:hypothetical protein